MTISAILLGKFVSLTAVCWVGVICAAGFVGLMARELWLRKDSRLSSGVGRWPTLIAVGIALIWLLFVVTELVDVGVGSHLYLSVTVFDHALRAAFTDAVLRTGVPPANPIYWPGHAAPMRYYYFWYVLVAVAARLAGATARQAMIASSAWSGFGLSSVVALYCKNFLGVRMGSNPSRKTKTRWIVHLEGLRRNPPRVGIALGMLLVTGLDILPVIAKALARMPTDGDMEWWSGNSVCSWVDSMLWVPHHVAGLVCCLTGFLLVWMSKGQTGVRRWGGGVLAGLVFASAFGLSTWIAIAFALVMIVWMAWAMVWERDSRGRVAVLLLAAAVTSVVLMPYLAELHGDASEMATLNAASGAYEINPQAAGGLGAAHLMGFTIRPIIAVDSLNGWEWIAHMARVHPAAESVVAGILLLVPGYFVELGFYGVVLGVALWAMRRGRLDEAGRTVAVLSVAGLAVPTFLRSTVIANNDFGLRSSLIMQFFLLLLAVLWWEGGLDVTKQDETIQSGTVLFGRNRWLHRTMIVMAGLGLAGTIYQSVVLRVYLPVEERLGDPQAKGLSGWAMALRQGFDAMDARVAKNAVVQYNSAQTEEYFSLAQALSVRRQTVRGQSGCGAEFGGDVGQCQRIEQDVAHLFGAKLLKPGINSEHLEFGPTPGSLSTAGRAPSADEARALCGRLSVSYLVATRWDAVWADPQGWVWTLPEVVDTYNIRVIDCTGVRP
jgi:hypothetical protein